MTDLNTSSFQETFTDNLQTALNTKSKKVSILLWTNHNPKLPKSFILKKADKKYLGLPRKDRKGETYWSFKEIEGKRSQSPVSSNSRPVMDKIAKFEQRQAKTQEYGKSTNEQSESKSSESSH